MNASDFFCFHNIICALIFCLMRKLENGVLMQVFKHQNSNPRIFFIVACICLFATTAWAGPYSGGQFGLYGLYVFLYLALPAVLILTIAKTIFWSKLTAEASGQKLLILKTIASFALAALEFFFATAIISVIAIVSGQVPLVAEIDRYTSWAALTGWVLFFLILGRLDIRNNHWLMKKAESSQSDRTFPKKFIYAGAIGLWLALGILGILVCLLSLR